MDNLRIFTAEIRGSTMIVAPDGPVSNFAGHELQSDVAEILNLIQDDRVRDVVIDMQKVDFFGSVLLGAMNSIWKQIRPRQGRLLLCSLSDVGREVVHVAKFDTLWPVFASREAALESLAD